MRVTADGREALLGYCTNVHPAETLAEVWEVLRTYAVPLKKAVSPHAPLGVGLYLPAAAAEPLAARRESAEGFREFLAQAGLLAFTVNAFPYGDFHGARVKEMAYRPDWTTPKRLEYTLAAARGLAALLEPGQTGTVSTLPGSWKAWGMDEGRLTAMADNLLAAASALDHLREETGRTLVLCLEPEPGCVLETTAETVSFFNRHLLGRHVPEAVVRRHLGACLDTAHLAVQFEEPAAAIRHLADQGIRIGKAQLSSALAVREPWRHPEAVAALKAFQEPRFLHQLSARTGDGILHLDDLPRLDGAGEAWLKASEWRCHFHVPVHRAAFPPLATTQAELKAALPALLALPERPHLEIETYTWSVLPEGERPRDAGGLVDGIAGEFAWVREQIEGKAHARETLF